jgi:hypothetical protein
MSRYLLVDGVLQRSTPELKQWMQRSGVPKSAEEERDAVALPRDTRTDFQIIQDLEDRDA